MLGVQFHKTGDLSAVRAAIARSDPEVIYREVFGPFMQWVLRIRIPKMYWNKGRISGADGQPVWLALSKWTIASKGQGQFIGGAGARGTVTAPMQTAQMEMARSYETRVTKTGPTSFHFEMSNRARSRSRWSPGFDYPSALHEGWGPYTVRPRPDGPGFLAWRMQAQTIGASTGRLTGGGAEGLGWRKEYTAVSESGKKRKFRMTKGGLYSSKELHGQKRIRESVSIKGGWARAMETHPSGAPSRPHIKWFRLDIIALGDLVTRFVFKGVKSTPAVQP